MPDEPDLGPGGMSVWLGALVIALTGVAVIVLLGVTLLQSGYRIASALWIWIGLPLVLAVTAAVRISAGRLRQALRSTSGLTSTRRTSRNAGLF
jgi:predicted signal transduction protein with EAL and GGDEF domain